MKPTQEQNNTNPSKNSHAPKQQAAQVLTLDLLQGSADAVSGNTRKFRIHKRRVVIGTVLSADIRLTGEGVAPIHCVIEQTSDAGQTQVTIFDLASESGTRVNGEKVVLRDLRLGDELMIGEARLKLGWETPVIEAESVSAKPVVSRPNSPATRKPRSSETQEITPWVDESQVEDIFDYQRTSTPALEVVQSWRGTILNVSHYWGDSEVTIGSTRACDFPVPEGLNSVRSVLARSRSTSGFELNLEGGAFQGVVYSGRKLLPISSLSSRQLGFQESDFAKVSLGELDFYLCVTESPPRLKKRGILERDPLAWKTIATTLALMAFGVGGLYLLEPSQHIEAEQLPERIATILYQPEKYTSKPKPRAELLKAPAVAQAPEVKPAEPKPIPTQKLDLAQKPTQVEPPKEIKPNAQAAANSGGPKSAVSQGVSKAGEGARAKGKEGQRGSKNSKLAGDPQNKASRPSPQGGKGTGADAKSEVAGEGNVDLLAGSSAKVQNILGSLPNPGGTAGGDQFKGFGGFTTAGRDGLGLKGGGGGGGGSADTLAGGLGKQGIGGGRVGTGFGATGAGNGIIGGKTRVAIRSGGPEEAVVMGSIDAAAVEAALLAHRDEFRLCYEREINADSPAQPGRVGTTFVIGTSGRVNQAGIESSSLKNAKVEQCILTVIKRIDFPIPRGGGVVQVSYPFKFSLAGRG